MSLNSNTTGLEEILASVNALPEAGAGEPTLQEKTVTPSTLAQSVTPDTGYDGLSKVTVNAMPTATQATPSIVVDTNGKITASATQSAGYVSAGTKSATKQLTTQAAKTITPTTSSQTAVASGRYTTGAVTVAGDANLVAGNIKSGVSIFGVAGNYEGSGGGGSVETCMVEISSGGPVMPEYPVTYTNENMTVTDYSATGMNFMNGFTLTIAKGTILIIGAYGTSFKTSGDVQLKRSMGANSIFVINGNGTITITA